MKENAIGAKKPNHLLTFTEIQPRLVDVTMNVKSALKHVLKHPIVQILMQPEIVIYVALTASISLTSTVWSWPKAPSAPAVEQTSLEANTINGA